MGKNSVGGYKHFIDFHLQFCFNVTKDKKIKTYHFILLLFF